MNESFKAIIVGDPHTMGRNPVNRLDNYPEALNNKWNEIIELGHEIQADKILVLGDIFDLAETALTTIGSLGSTLQKSKIVFDTIIGNHDIIGGNLSTYKRTGIGLLSKLNIINIIEDDSPQYIEKGNLKIQITGRSYHSNIDHQDPELDYCVKKENGATHAIHLVHGYLVPKKVLFSHTLVDSIAYTTEADATFAGHWHTPYLEIINGKFYGNPGGLGRITASKSEFRQPQVFICEVSQEGVMTVVPYIIKCAAKPEDVLDRTTLDEDGLHYYQMNEFIQSVSGFEGRFTLNPMELIHSLAATNQIEEAVKQDALMELSKAEIELAEE